MKTVSISIRIDPAIEREIDALGVLFESAPESVRQCLLHRLPGLLASLSNLDLTLAPVAGECVLVAQLSAAGWQEFRAAAACASQVGSACVHGCPSRKMV